jgi:light-regulated signal transduction histidine kinase (bacteriophytochrome)
MNPELLASLQSCCRDDAAFAQLQAILNAEIQPLTQKIAQAQFQVERQKALFRVVTRLREPLDLEAIFQVTAAEVRQLLGADRVGMFRFYPESGFDDGEFVSEDMDSAYDSALGRGIHDHCFGEHFANQYHFGRIQNVADIHQAGLSDCHIQILSQFQVRANLVIPLLQGDHLWGLLCIHQCRAPRQWQETEVEFAQQIANHLAVALKHAELLAELKTEVAERQQAEQQALELNQGLQQAVIELRAANQELEAFSYSVSHDLRAPLRSLDGFSQALLEDYLELLDANGQDYLHRIRLASQRMGQLIDDLLTLSRVTRSDLHWASVDLSQLARRASTHLQQLEPNRQVEFQLQTGLIGWGDGRLLLLVFENLLSNAWKFTSKRPFARIEFGATTQENGQTTYFVRDNGEGFEMTFVDKLFKPFQRLHGIHEFPGNGIGLATIQRIIQRHGGQVWAEAELNQGAVFYFTLGVRNLAKEQTT